MSVLAAPACLRSLATTYAARPLCMKYWKYSSATSEYRTVLHRTQGTASEYEYCTVRSYEPE